MRALLDEIIYFTSVLIKMIANKYHGHSLYWLALEAMIDAIKSGQPTKVCMSTKDV